MKPKLLVIGLDCGTFKFIKPYAESGYLPNLEKLMADGTFRILKSTIPPVSPPAWTTFLTGKNPGSHGVFQFVNMDISDYAFTSNRLINSTLFSGSTFIDLIGDNGLKVGIVKIPFTYPPWEVNGFMIAGEPSPDWTKAHTYPPQMAEKLERMNLGDSRDFMLYNTERLIEHLNFDCDVRTKITCDMLDKRESDFFMVVHTATDAAAHRFWKFSDASCPNYKASFKKYKNAIRDVYIMVDRSIGQIMQKIDEQTTVLIMSDHGADRNALYHFHLNAWLRDKGYLSVMEEAAGYKEFVKSSLVNAKNRLPARWRHFLVTNFKKKYLKKVSDFQDRLNNFEWAKTLAYAVSIYPTVDGITLNMAGRQAAGVVKPGREADRLLDEIQTKLIDVTDPRTGSRIVADIFHREEIYRGDSAKKMPDLIIKYNPEYRGGLHTSKPVLSDVPATAFDFQSGNHDEDGIFIAKGPAIQKGLELSASNIQDMAPTILYAMGLSIPSNMDGRVMLDIFCDTFVASNPVQIGASGLQENKTSYDLTDAEQAEMQNQLKGLGYF